MHQTINHMQQHTPSRKQDQFAATKGLVCEFAQNAILSPTKSKVVKVDERSKSKVLLQQVTCNMQELRLQESCHTPHP